MSRNPSGLLTIRPTHSREDAKRTGQVRSTLSIFYRTGGTRVFRRVKLWPGAATLLTQHQCFPPLFTDTVEADCANTDHAAEGQAASGEGQVHTMCPGTRG